MPKTYEFYLSGGQVLTITGIKTFTLGHNTTTGVYNSYKVVWEDGKSPKFFSLNLNEILAVVCRELN